MTDLFVWAAERQRAKAARARRLAPHGQVTSRTRVHIFETARAIAVEVFGTPHETHEAGINLGVRRSRQPVYQAGR